MYICVSSRKILKWNHFHIHGLLTTNVPVSLMSPRGLLRGGAKHYCCHSTIWRNIVVVKKLKFFKKFKFHICLYRSCIIRNFIVEAHSFLPLIFMFVFVLTVICFWLFILFSSTESQTLNHKEKDRNVSLNTFSNANLSFLPEPNWWNAFLYPQR